MKIDSHIRDLPELSIALLRRDPAYRVTLDGIKWYGGNFPDFEITPPKWFDLDTALAVMRKNGIDMDIMSAAPKPSSLRPSEASAGIHNLCLDYCGGTGVMDSGIAPIARQRRA